MNGDAGLHSRLDEHRLDSEVMFDHPGERAVQRGNDGGNDRSFEFPGDVADQLSRQDPVFVGSALACRGQPPRAHQIIAAIDAQDDVRVPDVDHEKVGHLEIGYYVITRSPALMLRTSFPSRSIARPCSSIPIHVPLTVRSPMTLVMRSPGL